MKRLIYILLIAIMFTGCKKEAQIVQPQTLTLSVEQINSFKEKVDKLVQKKIWVVDDSINYLKTVLPNSVENTYYQNILQKSKDGGYDFAKYLGKEVVEGIVNIKYSNGDTAGVGHFFFYNNNIIGAYYNVGDYIYSLNERNVFKKNIEWQNIENIQKKEIFKDIPSSSAQNLIYWSESDDNKNYLFSWQNSKLNILYIESSQLVLKNSIELSDLFIVDMFLKDMDKDNKKELALLVSTKQDWWDKTAQSQLIVYNFEDKLKRKYTLNFEQPMWSIDFDGKNIITTSDSSIEMYNLEDATIKKNYAYNKVGGKLRVDDIDKNGVLEYILVDSKGTDIYVFQWNAGLEEIWRSYNLKPEFGKNLQIADLNNDGVKEIYIEDINSDTRKLILAQNGFVFKLNDIKKGHRYFTGDFDGDGKYEYFDMFKKIPSAKTITTVLKN